MNPRSEPGDPMPCERCGQPHARCKGHRRSDGGPCTQPPMPGQRVCYWHGGAKPAARANGERREQEEQARAELRRLHYRDAEPVTDPVLALQKFTGVLTNTWDELGSVVNRLERLEADGSGRARVEVALWLQVAKELRQGLEAMTRYGIEDRVTAVLEAQGEQVAELVQAIGRALLAELVGLLADQPAAVDVLEGEYERVFSAVTSTELGVRHELETGGAT